MDVDLNNIELRWQKVWEDKKIFVPKGDGNKPKYFNFDSAPFANGDLHLGHARNYILGDIVARYKRLSGYDVLYCTNFDSFGLPNQLEAERQSKDPQEFTEACISRMKRDLRRLGISYDWTRVNATSDPAYYKWTQWLFLELYSAGLVYRKDANVNWCINCNTVLSWMEAERGHCGRCNGIVERRQVPQWFIALSKFSEKLYSSIDDLDGWSDRAKNLVKGFIGKSSGNLVSFSVSRQDQTLDVFIPEGKRLEDVSFVGAAVDAPEIKELFQRGQPEVIIPNFTLPKRRNNAEGRNGCDSRIRLIHPLSGIHIPLLFVDYLSGEEGPPIMAGTPASDKEDEYLASKLSLPEANERDVVKQEKCPGVKTKNYYHVHDWMVSRQKKWGAPLPMIDCGKCGFVPVPEKELPIPVCPRGKDSNTTPGVVCPRCQKLAKHVTDTLDCYIDDVWCFLSSELHSKENFTLARAGRYGWFPADQYHAGYDIHMYLHLYRFVSRFLYERGYLDTSEPITVHFGHDMVLQADRKMSKRHQNAIGVRALMDVYGADVVRVAIMLAANPGRPIRWKEEYASRAGRSVKKVLEMASMLAQAGRNLLQSSVPVLSESRKRSMEKKWRNLVTTITRHIESYRPGTCAQYLEKYTKELYEFIGPLAEGQMNSGDFFFARNHLLKLCVLCSPFMPHAAEEAWEQLAGEGFVAQATWPNEESFPG